MIKAILFDFDGVLTTDKTGSESTCKYISAQTGLDHQTVVSAYRKYNSDLLYGKTTHADIWGNLCRDIGAEISFDVLTDSFIHTPIDWDMVRLVEKAKENQYKTGLVTDNKKDRIDSVISHNSWGGLFDAIAVSADVGSGKNKEYIFSAALKQLGLAAAGCIFIDNSPGNLIVPEKMGIKTIFFDDEERDIPALITSLCDSGVML